MPMTGKRLWSCLPQGSMICVVGLTLGWTLKMCGFLTLRAYYVLTAMVIFDKVVGRAQVPMIIWSSPISELLARIHALLRRISAEHKGQAAEAWLQYEDLRLDREKLLLVCGEETAALTANEYKLLELMMKKPHNVFTREYLYEEVWGELPGYNDRTVDVTISRLRRKILQLCGKKYFQAVRGLGYRFGEKS